MIFNKFDVNEELKKLYQKNGYIHVTKYYDGENINLVLEAMQKAGYEIVDLKQYGNSSRFCILYR